MSRKSNRWKRRAEQAERALAKRVVPDNTLLGLINRSGKIELRLPDGKVMNCHGYIQGIDLGYVPGEDSEIIIQVIHHGSTRYATPTRRR